MNHNTAVTAGVVGLAVVASLAVYSLGIRPPSTAQAVVVPPPIESSLTTDPQTVRPASGTAPVVHTSSVNTVSSSVAALRGTVNPNGLNTIYWFEYSTDPNISPLSLRVTSGRSLEASTRALPITIDVAGLTPRTTYYYRIVAQNSFGISYGNRATFKTK